MTLTGGRGQQSPSGEKDKTMRKTPVKLLLLSVLMMLAACSAGGSAGPAASQTQAPKTLNVYVSTNAKSSQNAVYALSGSTGKLLWSYSTGANGNNPPLLDQGVVYVGSGNTLDALNAQNGKLLWSHQAPGAVRVLGVVDGVVYAASESLVNGASSGDSSLFALKASDGAARWNYSVADLLVGNELLADRVIYALVQSKQSCHCSGQPSYTLALNASDGSVLWKTAQASDIYGVRLAANGLVYGIDGMTDEFTDSLLARKASDGSVAWQFPKASAPAYVNIIGMNGNVVYVLSNDGNLGFPPLASGLNVVYALNASDGTVLWRAQVTSQSSFLGTLFAPAIYIGADDSAPTVFALNTADGKLLWQGQIAGSMAKMGSLVEVAAVVDGSDYLSYPQGVAALSASDGSMRWKYEGNGISSVAAVLNGVVYASSTPGDPAQQTISALKASDGSLLWSYAAPLVFNPPVVG